MIARRFIAISFVVLGLVIARPFEASAHPLDQLTQHLFVELRPTEVDLTVAVGGGLLANELVLSQLDPDGDGTVTDLERANWLRLWTETLTITLDRTPAVVDAAQIALSIPPLEDFHLGLTPMLLSFTVPLPGSGPEAQHLLSIRNDYLINRTTYRINVESGDGTEMVDQSWPGSAMRIAFTADPSVLPGERGDAAQAAREWSGSKLLSRARELLEHDKTPGFVLVLMAIFAFMGALHAIQPGHGKTLVAAYLVATGGTPRDALMLAGIVTFTHTISVFALGVATLAASQLFLPSKVIPVMGALSGVLIAAMGISMLRSSLKKIRSKHKHEHHSHDHHHDHAALSDEEHARLHLEEALAVRRGVSKRSLLTLGISGGMAPCPDALAILLLAIGMNQAEMGILAIVAFSAGLAVVLVAFGLAVSLVRPAWNRAKSGVSRPAGRLSSALSRAVALSPIGSAIIVLALGLAMAWRSISLG
jgi:ABC-type nickel/cobalt efflux system permease component RcnA